MGHSTVYGSNIFVNFCHIYAVFLIVVMMIRNIVAIYHAVYKKAPDSEAYVGIYGRDWIGIIWIAAAMIS